jgi:hypothetical protein
MQGLCGKGKSKTESNINPVQRSDR